MSYHPKGAGERIHRAVPLTNDEASYLSTRAINCGSKPCCPHLDVFHNEGRTSSGAEWRSCNLCDCTWETFVPPRRDCHACGFNPIEAKRETFQLAMSFLLLGAAIGAIAGWLLG